MTQNRGNSSAHSRSTSAGGLNAAAVAQWMLLHLISLCECSSRKTGEIQRQTMMLQTTLFGKPQKGARRSSTRISQLEQTNALCICDPRPRM
jgi:hypothetical protein